MQARRLRHRVSAKQPCGCKLCLFITGQAELHVNNISTTTHQTPANVMHDRRMVFETVSDNNDMVGIGNTKREVGRYRADYACSGGGTAS